MRYVALIYSDENGAAGVIGGGEALQATTTATTIRDVDGKDVITDGPFAETKEQLGGFYLLDAANLDEALKWAAKIPHPGSCIEVRPVVDFSAT
jgi:hypothetical protein